MRGAGETHKSHRPRDLSRRGSREQIKSTDPTIYLGEGVGRGHTSHKASVGIFRRPQSARSCGKACVLRPAECRATCRRLRLLERPRPPPRAAPPPLPQGPLPHFLLRPAAAPLSRGLGLVNRGPSTPRQGTGARFVLEPSLCLSIAVTMSLHGARDSTSLRIETNFRSFAEGLRPFNDRDETKKSGQALAATVFELGLVPSF